MSIPIFSQNLVINQIMRGEAVSAVSIAVAIAGSLLAGLLIALIAIKLYKRESMLFSD